MCVRHSHAEDSDQQCIGMFTKCLWDVINFWTGRLCENEQEVYFAFAVKKKMLFLILFPQKTKGEEEENRESRKKWDIHERSEGRGQVMDGCGQQPTTNTKKTNNINTQLVKQLSSSAFV